MTQSAVDNPSTPTCPSNFSLVYRALLKKRYINQSRREVQPEAFLCRPGNDFLGLSVNFTAEQCLAHFVKPPHGIAHLHIDDIHSLLLDVIPTRPDHANISGVPRLEEIREADKQSERYDEFRDKLVYDTGKAEFLAGELAKKAQLV